jgi:hypothetical protein
MLSVEIDYRSFGIQKPMKSRLLKTNMVCATLLSYIC